MSDWQKASGVGVGEGDTFNLEHSELGAYRIPESAAHLEIRGRAARADLEVTGDSSLGLSVTSSPEKCAEGRGPEKTVQRHRHTGHQKSPRRSSTSTSGNSSAGGGGRMERCHGEDQKEEF